MSEKFASYYGNLRGLLLGSNLTGRRAANFQENPFSEDAQLTAYKKDKDKEGKEGLCFSYASRFISYIEENLILLLSLSSRVISVTM